MEIKVDFSKPEEVVESMYLFIKGSTKAGHFKQEHVEALAEQLTELSNRMKAGEYSGEQEG